MQLLMLIQLLFLLKILMLMKFLLQMNLLLLLQILLLLHLLLLHQPGFRLGLLDLVAAALDVLVGLLALADQAGNLRRRQERV